RTAGTNAVIAAAPFSGLFRVASDSSPYFSPFSGWIRVSCNQFAQQLVFLWHVRGKQTNLMSVAA
ncbi:hypothetical protein, partial [Klebsiella pneumoniae]|uniref:hypothetical protein n=1 Tax=Klebsiella pneumoniae TaxID=573 RepID=UPI0034E94A76